MNKFAEFQPYGIILSSFIGFELFHLFSVAPKCAGPKEII